MYGYEYARPQTKRGQRTKIALRSTPLGALRRIRAPPPPSPQQGAQFDTP